MKPRLFDSYNPPDDGEFGSEYIKTPPTCKQCGKQDLKWRGVGLGWKLYEGSQPHVCKIEFEDLTK